MTRDELQAWIRRLFRWLTTTTFEGTEYIPKTGGVLIATNHMSRLDIPVLFINPVRNDITALVADKYLKYPVFKWFTETAGGVWLDRKQADFGAFRETAKLLKDGRAVGIAPEGTRSNISELLEGKPGTILLADRAKVPIVPVAIIGSEDAIKKLLTFRRPKIIVRFGPAYSPPPLERATREAQLKEYTDELMLRIGELMPEKYWGFYKMRLRERQLQKVS